MKTFNIEEIRNYILSQDSLGDVLYNLSEDNINKANSRNEKYNIKDRYGNIINAYDYVYLNDSKDFYVVMLDDSDENNTCNRLYIELEGYNLYLLSCLSEELEIKI